MNTINFINEQIKELNLPYLSVIANDKNGKIFEYNYSKDFVANGKEKVYMYSMSKPITAVMGLKLLDEGKISLDDKLVKFFPEFKNSYVLDKNKNKVFVGDKITIKNLFTMTAGFNYNTKSSEINSLLSKNSNPSTLEVINAISKTPLEFTPGEKFNYSLCHDVLAGVIELVLNKKYSEAVNDYIFKPLNMVNSSFSLYDNDNIIDQYIVKKDKSINKIDDYILFISKNYESGGAGLISTNYDYSLFADCLRNGGISKDGYKLINESTLKLLYGEQLSNFHIEGTFTCVQGDNYGYGLGVRTRRKPTDWGLPIGEFGWDGAAGSYIMVDPVNKVSVVIGAHLLNWPIIMIRLHLQIVKNIYNEFNLVK